MCQSPPSLHLGAVTFLLSSCWMSAFTGSGEEEKHTIMENVSPVFERPERFIKINSRLLVSEMAPLGLIVYSPILPKSSKHYWVNCSLTEWFLICVPYSIFVPVCTKVWSSCFHMRQDLILIHPQIHKWLIYTGCWQELIAFINCVPIHWADIWLGFFFFVFFVFGRYHNILDICLSMSSLSSMKHIIL